MIISSPSDYKKYAKRTLPPFLFDYIDGGANAEVTLGNNTKDLQQIALKQRVLRNVEDLDLTTEIFGQKLSMPVALSPVGLTGMYARRGEIQALKAAKFAGIPFTMSSVSVCPIEEAVAKIETPPLWFQLYVLKDRGFMKNVLERAMNNDVKTLVFTVDMPTPGSRYRDAHSGMSGPFAAQRRILQAMLHPKWAFDVGLLGTPHDLGNVSAYLGKPTNLADYMGWLGANFDPSIAWKDLEWIRDYWHGDIIIKGILNKDDAIDAKTFGANGIVVSNHGGRQLDGVISTTRALPAIAEKVKGDMKIFADSGIRSGLDVVRMLALGADVAMIGRAYIYALAADGERGVKNLLDIFAKEIKVAMTLTGVKSVSKINKDCLDL